MSSTEQFLIVPEPLLYPVGGEEASSQQLPLGGCRGEGGRDEGGRDEAAGEAC